MKKMLILEDDAPTAEILVEYISSFDIIVFVCATVPEALEVARREQPQLVYLDVLVSGRNVINHVPEFRAILPSAFIVLSSASARHLKDCEKLPVNDCLPKPFSLHEIDRIVDQTG